MDGKNRSEVKPDWAPDRQEVKDPVVVTVWKSNRNPPRFRIEVSFKNREGVPVRSMPVYSDSGVVTMASPSADIASMFNAAFDHVTRETEKLEEAWRASRLQSRHNQGNEGRPGLKTLSKQDKQRKYGDRSQGRREG
jgi:hypothetical protein